MPELPEVETIRRQLLKEVIGKKIKKAEIKLPKLIFFQGKKGDVKNFQKILSGAVIKKTERRAKILIITFFNGYALFIHLKLTGQLIYQTKNGKIKRGGHPWPRRDTPVPNKWTHIVIHFTDGSKIYFNDLRQFGYMKIVRSQEINQQPEIKKLGPEPLTDKFTLNKFKEILSRRPKKKIKALLIDQDAIAGIGNIYSDEVLFYAGVLPTRPAGKLTPKQAEKLYQGIKTILKKAILKGGSSVDNYVMLSGKKGGFEPYLMVYGREEKKCKKCGALIKRMKIGGRSAHYCEKCQR